MTGIEPVDLRTVSLKNLRPAQLHGGRQQTILHRPGGKAGMDPANLSVTRKIVQTPAYTLA